MNSKLFQPITIGDLRLQHRIVLAPLTRFRANAEHVIGPLAPEYYAQRASEPGTLLVTEATLIAPEAGGMSHVPGVYTDEQIAAWKKVTRAVHDKGSFIFLQLWALGHAASVEELAKQNPPLPYVSASNVKPSNSAIAPHPLTIDEIHNYVDLYATAAANAVNKAGFDGVEIHGANGYLLEQFLKDSTNLRTDQYGGSPENKSRFVLEIVDAVVKTVGEKKTGIRLSPWNTMNDMGTEDPVPTYSHLITQIRNRYPEFGYLHAVEPRVDGYIDKSPLIQESNNFLRAIWGDRPFVSAGGHTRESGIEFADKNGDLIAYGRSFISNPDLPYRLKENIPLVKGDRRTYYTKGSLDPTGYTSYPFATRLANKM